MFRKNESVEDSNFWISYADLMAGLLFVFILLIGMIVSKSIILKSNLHDKEDRLENTKKNLEDKLSKVDELKIEVKMKDELAKGQDETLTLKDEAIQKLNKLLLKANIEKDNLNGKIIILSNQVIEQNSTLKLKDEEMLHIMNALDEKATKYNLIVANLQKQKAKIKSLTGIKIKVILALKKALGKNIAINPKNGSLRLSSNILFDKGSASLKPEAQDKIKEVFEKYIGELLTNKEIKSYLDRIIVEGHTDSDGTYLRNLELSQERAFEVMTYILSLDFSKKHNLKSLIIATGRSYLDIIKVNGIEDKDASRRIDIKFRLKNQDAMEEIEKVLDAE